MTSRVLPPEEWHRLHETDIPAVLPYVTPADFDVVVVEDGARIVGAWAVWRVTHLEGLWIAPDHRGRGSVARRLLTATLAVARQWTPRFVMTMAQTDDIRHLLTTHVGAVPIPGDTYVFPVRES